MAWTQADGQADYVFVANTDGGKGIYNFNLPLLPQVEPEARLELVFSTADRGCEADKTLTPGDKAYKVMSLEAGEGRVYHVRR